MEFTKESHGGHGEAIGTATLYVDDRERDFHAAMSRD